MEDYQIFISYRRDGGLHFAGRLSDRLNNMGYKVFYDIESMQSGPFNMQIYAALDKCSDVLLVLPPNGLDRCSDEGDWVRKEIEYAIRNGKNMIPLMMPGFSFPQELPESIRDISWCEGVAVDVNYFDAMIARIVDMLTVKAKAPATDGDNDLVEGIRFLKAKIYAQALMRLEKVICEEISEPDAYFYAAIAKMAGKRPFLLTRPLISEIESYLDSAIAYGERAVYYALYAYIKQDYYEKKMLRSLPPHTALLVKAKQLGLTNAETTELFALLGTQKPQGF